MGNQEQVKATLMVIWDNTVLNAYMTYDELTDSLLDQITGACDLSPDELTDEMAELMGWDPDAITDDQYEVWRNLVNEAANEYMYGNDPTSGLMTIDKVKGILLARGWNMAGIEPILEDVEAMKEGDRTRKNILKLIEDYEDR